MREHEPDGIGLLTVCGSLQRRSANRAALLAASGVARDRGARVDDFGRIAELPALNPDRADEHIGVVDEWRHRVEGADCVLIAAPEYAGGVAGAVKNAFDWLVGSGTMYRKPVAVISAGTTGGLHARRQLARTLTWQGGYVVAELGISAPRTKSDDDGLFIDLATLAQIRTLTETLLGAGALPPGELVALAGRVVGSLGVDTGHVAPPERSTATQG